ncbi:MAG: hypothetical protein PHH67_09850 [Methanosarcina sp.]|nr:hypothetical protein [Methanosarcina sp.]MDD3318242.1 hypothetical protein [Methanosarcina sp.]MDD4306787.1 hypothetical protein [Methanosarcina sp.]MDD4621015.1 hypothetical protein [Methanosarcina sp.]NLN44142.1 hypothetical protein [Methanosarcina sp.]
MHVGSSEKTILEEEYRAVFREIFEEHRLSPGAIDTFEFFNSSKFM